MDTKYLNFFLILVIILLIALNVLANFRNKEQFQDVSSINSEINKKIKQ